MVCQNFVVVVVYSLSPVRPFVTPWTTAHQAPLSMEFPRQEYRSKLPFPSPGNHPNPGIELASPALQTDSLMLRQWGSPCHSLLVSNCNSLLFLNKLILLVKKKKDTNAHCHIVVETCLHSQKCTSQSCIHTLIFFIHLTFLSTVSGSILDVRNSKME